ncbi:MAG: hypothetical protein MUO64_13600 [Anaerolineales bacterium]|nr:hypothetical protein [Anaerolineales bacterium]
MNNHKAKFLEAEEQANRLVSQMQELQRKMEAHEEAATSLSEVTTVVTTLTREFTETSVGLSNLVIKLSEIGTPSILESIDATRAELARFMSTSYSRVLRFLWIAIAIGITNLIGLLILAIALLRHSI